MMRGPIPWSPTGSEDSCPRVKQPTQSNTAGYCSTTGCHVSCAVGCRVANSITECTQETVRGRALVCGRCKPGWNPIPTSDFGCQPNTAGTSNKCTRGKDTDKDSVGNR